MSQLQKTTPQPVPLPGSNFVEIISEEPTSCLQNNHSNDNTVPSKNTTHLSTNTSHPIKLSLQTIHFQSAQIKQYTAQHDNTHTAEKDIEPVLSETTLETANPVFNEMGDDETKSKLAPTPKSLGKVEHNLNYARMAWGDTPIDTSNVPNQAVQPPSDAQPADNIDTCTITNENTERDETTPPGYLNLPEENIEETIAQSTRDTKNVTFCETNEVEKLTPKIKSKSLPKKILKSISKALDSKGRLYNKATSIVSKARFGTSKESHSSVQFDSSEESKIPSKSCDNKCKNKTTKSSSDTNMVDGLTHASGGDPRNIDTMIKVKGKGRQKGRNRVVDLSKPVEVKMEQKTKNLTEMFAAVPGI